MNGKLAFLLTAALLALLPLGAAAQSKNQSNGYDAFKLVKTRNIFDPERRPSRTESSSRPTPTTNSTARASNYVTLTGTMVTAGKTLAFFTGSRREYSKVVPVGESVADFKITGITEAQVEFERGGKQIVVAVGHAVPIDGATATPPGGAPPPPAEETPASASPASPATPAGSKEDIIRRMMERRQKEISK